VERRRQEPDFFARLVDGTAVVVDVRADDNVDANAAAAFAASAEACKSVGWCYRRVGVLGTVVAANVRWLSGHRHPRRLDTGPGGTTARRVLVTWSVTGGRGQGG
jgi:hypothetical protein